MLLPTVLAILRLMIDDERIETIKQWLGAGSINIFGRPFAGKDYQGKKIAEILGGALIGGGEILRNIEMPETIKTPMKAGELPPSKDFLKIVVPYLNQQSLIGKPLLLSSLGRWHGEEKVVIDALKESGHPLRTAIYLDIPVNQSRKRWQALEINKDRSDRIDDTESALSVRFNEFDKKTIPVLEYYRRLGLLIEIDGTGSRDEVTSSIIDALFELANN